MRNARRRFMHWLWANQDRLPDRVLDWRIFDWVATFAAWLGCKLAGHEPTCDQCGRPEHDYCLWCAKSMPNQAPRRPAPVETQKGNTE